MVFSEILKRLEKVLCEQENLIRVTQRDIALALNIQPQVLTNMKSKNRIPVEAISEFCRLRKISINWILYGQHIRDIEENTDKALYVTFYKNIYASAGGGAENDDEASEKLYLDDSVVQEITKLGQRGLNGINALNVIGNSMEPTLFNGDIILFSLNRKNPIKEEGIYVLRTLSGLFIKRLFIDEEHNLTLHSDNPCYSPEMIPYDMADTVHILGKVIRRVN